MKSASNQKTAGWKGFALQHVEKAVLGVMMIVLIMMMIKGFGKEGLKPAQTTQKLQETIEQAQQHIVSVKTIPKDNGGEKFVAFDFAKRLQSGLDPRDLAGMYKNLNLDPRIFTPIAKRTQPRLFPVEDVHAIAFVGQLALNDPKKAVEEDKRLQEVNNKKAIEDAKKAAKKALADEKKRRADELANSRTAARKGGGEGGLKGGLEQPRPEDAMTMMQPVVVRPPHPAIVNLKGIVSSTRGMAVVTALIPYRKQIEEYRRTLILEKDRIPDRKVELDLPIMTKFTIERAEVADPNADEAKLQWVDITPQTMEFFLSNRKQLDFAVPETVVASLLGPLTMPTDGKGSLPTVGLLPKLADRLWQREVTHPRIPLISDLTDADIQLEADNQALIPGAGVAQNNIFAKQNPLEGQPVVDVNPIDALPEYVLFRHLDLRVELNKSYRYRVSLTYYNANHLVDPKYVEEPSETRLELATAPSRPSNVVTLPPIRAVLAGGETSINRRSEVPPKSKLWFWELDTQRGGEVAKDFPEITVGDLLEHVATVKGILNRPSGRLEDLTDYSFSTYKKNRGVAGPGQNYGYLVDVIGGEKIGPVPREKGAKQEESPSEILIMDENGYLRSSNSRFAKEKLDAFKTRYQPTDGSATGGGVGNGETGENRGGGGILFGPPGGA